MKHLPVNNLHSPDQFKEYEKLAKTWASDVRGKRSVYPLFLQCN